MSLHYDGCYAKDTLKIIIEDMTRSFDCLREREDVGGEGAHVGG